MVELPPTVARHPAIDEWIAIATDGSVTVRTGKVEIGQGIKTALITVAAEELDVAPARIRIETAHTGRTPNEFITAGSRSIEDSGGAIRIMAAAARTHMLALAARALGVPAAELEVDDGTISGPGANRTLSYASVQGGRPFDVTVTAMPALKPTARYRLVARRQPRVDLPGKVFGRPAFVHDLAPADLVHARVIRPPNARARLASANLEGFSARGLISTIARIVRRRGEPDQ